MRGRKNPLCKFGNKWLIAYLSFLSAFAPLATDMYLPALPTMAEALSTNDAPVSYTLSTFMFTFAFSMLVWGPLSDRYGRKPILFWGTAVFTISSINISVSSSIWPLMFWRICQAIGAGSASAMSLAIVKDIMRGALMEKVISSMQAATVLAPMFAPVIGAGILSFTDWRGIFLCLAACGVLAFCGCFAMRETCQKNSEGNLAEVFARVEIVLKNNDFRRYLLIFSAMAMPFMSYLAVSAFIFQEKFGLSAQAYSMYFAFNAFCSLLGPLAHIFLLRNFRQKDVISCHLSLMTLAGIMICLLGSKTAWGYALLFAPISFCGAAMRPPATVLMMQSIRGNNGIVASLINCSGLIFGSLSMFLASLPCWPGAIAATGIIAATVSAICLGTWIYLLKRD